MSDPGMNDQGGIGNLQEADQLSVSPGIQLAAYRRERGWTVEQVASQLNLAPRQIAAIESGDYPALPGMPIVRGFIRAYAKVLKVDAAPLLATLGGETVLVHESIAPRQTLATPFSETRLPSMMERPGLSSKWIIGLLLVLLFGVALWALQQGSDLADISKAATSQVKDGLSQISGANLGAHPDVPKAEVPHEVATPESDMAKPELAELANPVPAPAATPAAEPSQAPPQIAAASPALATPGKDTLILKVREDSWVEIKRSGSGNPVVSRVLKAGETEAFEVTEPFSLVIGNAAGVDATLRGAPIELKAGGGNVARLNLK